jgi:hypothetical protein
MRPIRYLLDLPWWAGLLIFLGGNWLTPNLYPAGMPVALFGAWTFSKLLLSDVHANRHALEAVLAECRDEGLTDGLFLGDLVGYAADASACVRLAMETGWPNVAGNHDFWLIQLRKTGWIPGGDGDDPIALSLRHALATIVTVGAVGQPRDECGDNRAAWATWDPETREVGFRRTAYDIDAAAAIREAGLAEESAERLYGVEALG